MLKTDSSNNHGLSLFLILGISDMILFEIPCSTFPWDRRMNSAQQPFVIFLPVVPYLLLPFPPALELYEN